MIEGRILISELRVAEWLREALARDVQNKESLYSGYPNGWNLLQQRIDDHCRCWHFGTADRKLLTDHLLSLWTEATEFLEI